MVTTEQTRLSDMPWEDGDEPERPTRTPRRAARHRPPRRRGVIAGTVGVIGELMITLGVLLGLFVVWQIWWTDIEARAHQQEVIAEFQESPEYVEAPEQPGTERYDEPPIPSQVADGEVFATLHVPRWGSDYEVSIAEGVDQATVLDRGYVGRYPRTQMPGEIGNFGTAGHRQSYGAPFYGVQDLQIGDAIIVETTNAYLVYYVTADEVVTPDQVEVLYPVPHQSGAEATERLITFTTCHPLFSTRERWITYGTFDHWVDKSEGRPAELLEEVD